MTGCCFSISATSYCSIDDNNIYICFTINKIKNCSDIAYSNIAYSNIAYYVIKSKNYKNVFNFNSTEFPVIECQQIPIKTKCVVIILYNASNKKIGCKKIFQKNIKSCCDCNNINNAPLSINDPNYGYVFPSLYIYTWSPPESWGCNNISGKYLLHVYGNICPDNEIITCFEKVLTTTSYITTPEEATAILHLHNLQTSQICNIHRLLYYSITPINIYGCYGPTITNTFQYLS